MSYHPDMIINHQILTDAEGRPVAAQIHGDEFEAIRDRLDADGISVWKVDRTGGVSPRSAD